MVQLFYYETRGKCIRKIFTHEGSPTKIVLYPYEGWAQSALTSHWLLKTYWWSRSGVKITEVVGSQKIELKGKIKDCGHGNIVITGKYKERPNKDFRLCLTSNISNTDFDLGYCVTGTVERGDKDREKHNEKGGMDLTHFAMIKRKGY